jgi:hypothetical protein
MAQIDKPNLHFNTVLYTGNGSTNAQTGVGFQPDWLWVKCRSDANGHQLFDALRTTYSISSNETAAEANRASDGFTSLDSDGFTMNGSGSGGNTNVNGRTYVAWNWKAGGAGSANTDGSINSTVSVNTTAGFSIVKYVGNATSGATVGHGLSVAPKFIIIKSRDTNGLSWRSYHASLGAGKYIELDANAAAVTASNFMNDTAPTSTVFSLGNGTTPNKSGDNYIVYCFAEKKGYSKFGSYTGNGNADGPFIYTGFKPALVIIKPSSYVNSWGIFDNKRPGYNVTKNRLEADNTSAESTALDYFDFLSNGFKVRTSNGHPNTNGGTLIYMAFAENPIVGTNNVAATAR